MLGGAPQAISSFPGNVLLWGADQKGQADSAGAFNSSVANNDYVYYPKGQFLQNSQCTINRPGVTIEGANPAWLAGGVFQGGTQIVLGSAAGAGAAVFAWTGAGGGADYGGIVFSRFGIRLNNPGLAQIGIRLSQALSTLFVGVSVIGQGTSSDDTVGFQIDGLLGPYQYSGNIDVVGCYLTNHLYAINVQGCVTTMRVVFTTMNGSIGHATSCGILYGNGGNSNNGTAAQLLLTLVVAFCEIVQWHVGIQSWGQQLRQFGNYLEYNDTTKMGGNYSISAITQANPAVITLSTVSTNHPLATSNFAISGISNAASAVVTLSSIAVSNPVSVNCLLNFSGVSGMSAINGLSGTVTAVGGVSGAWTATVNINSSGFGAYTSGGNAGTGAVGNAVNPTGVGGMTQINGQQGVISAIAGTSGAWTVTLGGVNSFGSINSSAYTAYTSGGTLGTAQNINWVRGVGATDTQNASFWDWYSTGTKNFPQNNVDKCGFFGPATFFGALQGPWALGNNQLLFNSSGSFGSSTNLIYDGSSLITNIGTFFAQPHPGVALALNGANFGQIQQLTVSPDSWGLGYGSTSNTVGTSVLRWTATGDLPQTRGVAICKFKASAEDEVSDAVLANDADLTYAIPAAGTYEFEFFLNVGGIAGAGAGGISLNVNYSGTFTAAGSKFQLDGVINSADQANAQATVTGTVTTSLFTAATLANGTTDHIRIKGVLQATGTGTLALAWAQNTSNATGTRNDVGSLMKVTQLS